MLKSAQAGVPVEQVIAELENVLRSNEDSVKYNIIENLSSQVSNPEWAQRLAVIKGALKVPDSGMVDPISNNPYPQTDSLIRELINDMKNLHKLSEQEYPYLSKYAQVMVGKKKKRGNPFRVLMGKVGKLLDHGLERRDIVRYLLKEKIWNDKTIEKAVGIVKEYNKKKHSKEKSEKKEQVEKKSSSNEKIITSQTLPDPKLGFGKMKPNYSKRSNVELMISLSWLNSLDKVSPDRWDFAKEVADREGIKTMMREIKAELSKRGMSEDSLKLLAKDDYERTNRE